MSPAQSKMARAALGWSIDNAASASGISRISILRFEKGGVDSAKLKVSTIDALQAAYETAGIHLIEGGAISRDGGEGVRFRSE